METLECDWSDTSESQEMCEDTKNWKKQKRILSQRLQRELGVASTFILNFRTLISMNFDCPVCGTLL